MLPSLLCTASRIIKMRARLLNVLSRRLRRVASKRFGLVADPFEEASHEDEEFSEVDDEDVDREANEDEGDRLLRGTRAFSTSCCASYSRCCSRATSSLKPYCKICKRGLVSSCTNTGQQQQDRARRQR